MNTLIALSAPSEPGDLAFSALPDAPVVPDRARRRAGSAGWLTSTRAGLALRLRGLAAAVEPAHHPRPARG